MSKADGRNVGDDTGFGAALLGVAEICDHGGFEGGDVPVPDTDAILVGEEVCQSDGEFVRNIASADVAAHQKALK